MERENLRVSSLPIKENHHYFLWKLKNIYYLIVFEKYFKPLLIVVSLQGYKIYNWILNIESRNRLIKNKFRMQVLKRLWKIKISLYEFQIIIIVIKGANLLYWIKVLNSDWFYDCLKLAGELGICKKLANFPLQQVKF